MIFIVIVSVLLQSKQLLCVKTVVDMQMRDYTSCGHTDRHNISDVLVPFIDVSNLTGSIANETTRNPNGSRHQDREWCVRLLCPRGMWFTGRECRNDSRLFELNIPVKNDEGLNQSVNIFEQFDHSVGATCNEIIPLAADTWNLNENGSITTTYSNEILKQDHYFLTPRFNDNTTTIEFTAWICYFEEKRKYSIIGMIVSLPFLIVTLIVYAILPELRNLHGKSLMCYVAGLTIGFVSLSYVQVYPLRSPFCRIAGYLMYGLHMSTHFWLNVISFDMWRTFRTMQFKNSLANNWKFMKYNAYAWGMPIAMTMISFLLKSIPKLPSNVQPGVGLRVCFFDSIIYKYAFFYIPRVLLLIANGAFFIITALKIRKVQTELAAMVDSKRQQKSQFDQETEMFRLFFRLFIVMGLVWSMDVVMWIMELPEWTTIYLAAVVNGIQGVAIFFLFILKRKVKNMLVKRWRVWRGTDTITPSSGAQNVSPHRSFTGSTGSTSFSSPKAE